MQPFNNIKAGAFAAVVSITLLCITLSCASTVPSFDSSFVLYPDSPALESAQPTSTASTQSLPAQNEDSRPNSASHHPLNLQMTKKALEQLLGLDIHLNILADEKNPQTGQQDLLGRIPVHIKIRDVTIGGISLPNSVSSIINHDSEPVNYGNIHIRIV